VVVVVVVVLWWSQKSLVASRELSRPIGSGFLDVRVFRPGTDGGGWFDKDSEVSFVLSGGARPRLEGGCGRNRSSSVPPGGGASPTRKARAVESVVRSESGGV
jgi:hypothetical protein